MKKANWFAPKPHPPERRRTSLPLAEIGEWLILVAVWIGCSSETKPVDIYPEDACAQCRMAISDEAFASEIINDQREVFKFDDIGCMETFRERSTEMTVLAQYVKDYPSKTWLPYEQSHIVHTSIKTPMGSGRVAFADSIQATEFVRKYPPVEVVAAKHGCCAEEE